MARIGQEAAGNAVKHGGARNIRVELRYTPATVGLTVTDDGKGFDAAQPSRTGHFGVQDMRERAQSMGSGESGHACSDNRDARSHRATLCT